MADIAGRAAAAPLTPLETQARAALFSDARTANAFADTPVSDEDLREIWELTKWPPTAANSQPLRVLFLRTDEGRRRVIEHVSEGNKAKARTAPVIAVLAMDTLFHEYSAALLPHKPELREVYASDEQMRLETAQFNTALQAGYFILAVRAHGLAAGPMAGFDAASLDADFFPDGRWRSVLVINIGHPGPDPWFGRLPRLHSDDAITFA